MKIRHNKKTANTKRQFIPAKEQVSNKSTKQEKFILFLFHLGLVLLIWEVSIYRRTIIAFNIPLIIFIIPGVFLTLVFYEKFDKIQDAFKREKQIQKWSRAKKEALINGDVEELKRLAKSRT